MRHANQFPNPPRAPRVELTPDRLVQQITTIYRTLLTLSTNAAAKYAVETNYVLAEIVRRLELEGFLLSGKGEE